MKRIFLCITILIFSCIQPIYATQNITILIEIKNSEHMYLVNINNKQLKVKEINTKLYLPITCLDNEASTLKSVDFTKSYTCLINSLNENMNTKITNYVSIDLNKLTNNLNIKNEYDNKTLKSLCEIALKIKNKINLDTIIHYQDYIESDLDLETIYKLYKQFNQSFTTKYYHLNYYLIDNKYICLNKKFYLNK